MTENKNPLSEAQTKHSRESTHNVSEEQSLTYLETYFKFLSPITNQQEFQANFELAVESLPYRFTGFLAKQSDEGAILEDSHWTLAEIMAIRRDPDLFFKKPIPKHVLHVVPSETDYKGRCESNVKVPRTLLLELDGLTSQEEIRELKEAHKPHLIVESSPGKYHVYWKVAQPFPLELWVRVQKGLAHQFHGDTSYLLPTQPIRVPGYLRYPKDSDKLFMPNILAFRPDYPIVTHANYTQLLPFINRAVEDAEIKEKEFRKERRKASKNTNGTVYKMKAVKKGERNKALFYFCCEWRREHPDCTAEELIDFALNTNAMFEPPMEAREAKKPALSAMRIDPSPTASKKKKDKDSAPPGWDKFEPFLLSAEMGFYREICGNKLPTKEAYEAALSVPISFDDEALLQRVIDKAVREETMFRAKETPEEFYAFDKEQKIWVKQKSGGRYAVAGIIREVVHEVISHPMFIPIVVGSLNPGSARAAVNRVLSTVTINALSSSIFHHAKVPSKRTDIFDSHPHLFKCANGVIDLRDKRPVPREPVPTDYLLADSPVHYDSEATCPDFEIFLRQIFADKLEVIPFVEEYMGYLLTGMISEEKATFLTGEGNNGKTMFTTAIMEVMGSYKALLGSVDVCNLKGKVSPPIERVCSKFKGKRISVTHDVPTGATINEGNLKTITHAEVRVEDKWITDHEVANHCKHILCANDVPGIESENEGTYRRMAFLTFGQSFVKDGEKENQLRAAFKRELSGIFNLMHRGALRFYERGGKLQYPDCCIIAAEEYREDNFIIETTLKEMLNYPETEDGTAEWKTPAQILNYVRGEIRQNGRPDNITLKALGAKLQTLKPKPLYKKTKSGRFYYVEFKKEEAIFKEEL